MLEFYRFSEDDFESVSIKELKKGDFLSIASSGERYGAVRIDDFHLDNKIALITSILPVGMSLCHKDDRWVTVFWSDEGKHCFTKITNIHTRTE